MSTPVRSSVLTQFCREDLPNFTFERIIYNIVEPLITFNRDITRVLMFY